MDFYTFRTKIKNSLSFYVNRLARFTTPSKDNALTVGFVCGFHGMSGGAIAIGTIANMLASNFNVSFKVTRTSYFNRILKPKVKTSLKFGLADVYIVDLSLPLAELNEIKQSGRPIILSIHGFKDRLHHLDEGHIESLLSLVDHVHFVGSVQQDSYQLPEGTFTIIPNVVDNIQRSAIKTNNIGTVGNLDDERKCAALTVKYGEKSNCSEIHLWQTSKDYSHCKKVITHSWETNKRKIYSSFDVLVFLSKDETFGLVVAEALSAGVPCILSDIPAFSAFSDCSAVRIVDTNEYDTIPGIIDNTLDSFSSLSSSAQTFYAQYFSPEVVEKKWMELINIISKLP